MNLLPQVSDVCILLSALWLVFTQYEEEEGEDEEEEVRPMERSVKPIRLRRQVSHDVFRKCLVQHFDTEWIKKNVVWPTRNCKEVNK
jgi:hypothetical protein